MVHCLPTAQAGVSEHEATRVAEALAPFMNRQCRSLKNLHPPSSASPPPFLLRIAQSASLSDVNDTLRTLTTRYAHTHSYSLHRILRIILCHVTCRLSRSHPSVSPVTATVLVLRRFPTLRCTSRCPRSGRPHSAGLDDQ